MIVRLWELGTAVVILLVAAVFALGGEPIEAAVAGALGMFWLVSRGRVPEWLGAGYVRRRALLEFLKILSLSVVMLAALATIVVALLLGWKHDPEGPILFASLTGVVLLLRRELERRFETFEDLADGGDAELAVAEILDGLDGCYVEHNVLRNDGRGNIDHVVQRPDGEWFAIETKSGRYMNRHASQAVGCAVAFKKDRRLSWVTPVLCVGDLNQATTLKWINRSAVRVVSLGNLGDWLPTAQPTRGLRP